MAARRKVVEITIGDADVAKLQSIARSRTEPASRVERARILLRYRDNPSSYAVGTAVGVTHQTVQRCLARATRFGAMAALDDVVGIEEAQLKQKDGTVISPSSLSSSVFEKQKDGGWLMVAHHASRMPK